MNKENKNNKRTLGHVLSGILVSTCIACLVAIIIALTARFIFWLY